MADFLIDKKNVGLSESKQFEVCITMTNYGSKLGRPKVFPFCATIAELDEEYEKVMVKLKAAHAQARQALKNNFQ